MPRKPRIAIVGATGAVGTEIARLLDTRNFPKAHVKGLASRSRSTSTMDIEKITDVSFKDVDIAFFCANSSISQTYAPIAAKSGCVVIDNSSAFRMNHDVPLVVPEVNPHALASHQGIIANPNCSTIIMHMAVYPLHQVYGVERAVISTYQAASGAGASGMYELEQQTREWCAQFKSYSTDVFGRQYIHNLFSHNSRIDPDSGYNEEETKMIRETHKIWETEDVGISATCIRVPVLRAHCEAINLTLTRPASVDNVRTLLQDSPGVTLVDDRDNNQFPEPIMASGVDDVLVGRIRLDSSQKYGHGIDLFVAGDQLLKGAALNAVQIAEALLHE